jgi:2',3'-cyclic-nucleotide 2'-phosphodiesterase (5'-nucleotidase family)
VETADKTVKKLRTAGADIIVALTHLEIDQDRELAASVGGIDLILGGHDHDPITFYEGGVLIHKSGYDARYLGAIDLTIERKEQGGKKLISVLPAWRMVSTAGMAPDPEVKKLVDRYNVALDSELAAVIGKAGVVLDLRQASLRSGESNFGDLVAEAMRAAVGAEVAMVNGGAIVGDRTYDAGAQLTRKDILAALPYSNVTILLELTGADLLAALENGVSKVEEKAGRFPQVAGMAFVYDPKEPAGSRIVDVKVAGEPLEEDRLYRLATNDFVAAGGDGYETMKNGEALIDTSAGTLVTTTLMNYIAAKKTLSPQVDGRIRRK